MKRVSKGRLFQAEGPVTETDLFPSLSVRSWHIKREADTRRAKLMRGCIYVIILPDNLGTLEFCFLHLLMVTHGNMSTLCHFLLLCVFHCVY